MDGSDGSGGSDRSKDQLIERPEEPPKGCMSVGCTGTAVSALRISFVFQCKGFPPKPVSAWFGLYVCAKCGTQDNAISFAKAQEKHLMDLGQKIGAALGAQSFDIGKVMFDKRAGADKDFAAYAKMIAATNAKAAEEVAAHKSSIIDAANDNIQ